MNEEWRKINERYEVSDGGHAQHVLNRKAVKGPLLYTRNGEKIQGHPIMQLVYKAFVGDVPEGARLRRKDATLPPSVENIMLTSPQITQAEKMQQRINKYELEIAEIQKQLLELQENYPLLFQNNIK